jgi:hypothetical protein
MLQGRWRKKKRGKNGIGPLEGLGQKEFRVEIRDQIQRAVEFWFSKRFKDLDQKQRGLNISNPKFELGFKI